MGLRFITLKLNLQAKQEQFRNQEILILPSIIPLLPSPFSPSPILTVYPVTFLLSPLCILILFVLYSTPAASALGRHWLPLTAVD